MAGYLNGILQGQYEAALCMLDQCVRACRDEHWEGKIANGSVRWAAYHTLFFTEIYLLGSEEAFVLREVHARGGDEREPVSCVGLSREETLAYVAECRRLVGEILGKETPETLEAPCGFPRRKMSRGELHIYNIRHIQHHTGQISAYIRRVRPMDDHDLPWVSKGWK